VLVFRHLKILAKVYKEHRYTKPAFTCHIRQKMVKSGKKVKFYRRFRPDRAIWCVHAFQYQSIVFQRLTLLLFMKKSEFM
jgi:hypothetical protein